MQMTKIKVGKWYETNVGIGQCLETGGRYPPAAKFNIVAPLPRGVVFVVPRDVLKEAEPATLEKGSAQ